MQLPCRSTDLTDPVGGNKLFGQQRRGLMHQKRSQLHLGCLQPTIFSALPILFRSRQLNPQQFTLLLPSLSLVLGHRQIRRANLIANIC